ncbi:hypothetical protein COCON_G00183300 [Conger conger]|uniref:PiggyBac transposable element-derived protein domain-containing protein n=1 Tax=Conger conger TaxID=82655 RepID=A0A9Q1HT70_CONCO|nr:hypothetical protein COCON_G00183300 [Conger conger]
MHQGAEGPDVHIRGYLHCHLVVLEELQHTTCDEKMDDGTQESLDGTPRPKRRPGRISLSTAEWMLGAIDGDHSEVEDLSDIDDDMLDADYQPPLREPSSSEDSSGDEDPILQPTEPSRGRKRHRDQDDGSRSRRRRRRSGHVEADGSNDGPEEPTPGPSPTQSKKGRRMRWRATPLTPNLVQFEHEDETEQDREGWTPLDYVEQYIDKDLMQMIVDRSNATSLGRSGNLLNTSVDEMYHFFGACILMSCVPYPQIRMYWSKRLRMPAITEKFRRDRFFRLTKSGH